MKINLIGSNSWEDDPLATIRNYCVRDILLAAVVASLSYSITNLAVENRAR